MMESLRTESEIKREICEFLDRFPDLILFTVSPPKRTRFSSKFMRAGWPDIFGILKNIIRAEGSEWDAPLPFFIEVKKPGGSLSLEQHKLLEKAKVLGAITCVATCVEDVRKALSL